MKKLTLGLSAFALVAAGAAFAQPPGMGPGPDANGDGVVTRAEAQAHASQMFAHMDANNDGKLDQADRDLRREQRRTKMFEALDGNNDGQISRAEFMAFNHEGKRGEHGHDRWKGHRGGPDGGMMMRMADTNNDGSISQAEFTAAALKHFESMDANHDGKVSKEEHQTARHDMRGKWREKMCGPGDN